MTMYRTLLILMSVTLYIPAVFAKSAATEWGTFTSLIGSDGKTQDGMYHEDEALPDFVHGFGELVSEPIRFPQPDPNCRHSKIPCDFFDDVNRNVISQKMETPVIYFYMPSRTNVTVDVQFPEGMVTETYPGPVSTFPNLNTPRVIANGHTVFSVDVHPMSETSSLVNRLPRVTAGNIYEHARKVPDASVVEKFGEMENFIFYRGVGRFTPRTSITSSQGALALHQCSDCDALSYVFLVDVNDQGHARMIPLGGMQENDNQIVSASRIHLLRNHNFHGESEVVEGDAAFEMLETSLMYAGLTPDEASAMLNTWKNGYFKTPGLRLLYVLPRTEIDRILPVKITPAPGIFTRVFVGRIELLLDTDEIELMNKILAARDLIDVTRLGRFAESTLRRVREVYLERQGAKPSKDDLDLFQRLIDRAAHS